MSVRVLALESGVTTLEGHRLAISALTAPAAPLNGRSGVYQAEGAADLSAVSAMVAEIAPFSAWIDGGNSALQGGYLFTLDDAVELTFDDGNAATDRTDRVIAIVRDDVYDSSGATAGSVEILKGHSTTGAATDVPDNALLLYEVTVPDGASVGTGGITFSSAVADCRVWTAAAGGIFKVADAADRDDIVDPQPGLTVYRVDADWLERWNGGEWRPVGTVSVSSPSTLSLVTDPQAGDTALSVSDGRLYRYRAGVGWTAYGSRIVAYGKRATSTSASTSERGVLRLDGITVKAGRVYKVYTGPLHGHSTVESDYLGFILRYTTNGSSAGTGSTILPGGYIFTPISANYSVQNFGSICTLYTPGTDHSLSVLLTVRREIGTGSVYSYASSEILTQMFVEEVNPSVSDSGVVI